MCVKQKPFLAIAASVALIISCFGALLSNRSVKACSNCQPAGHACDGRFCPVLSAVNAYSAVAPYRNTYIFFEFDKHLPRKNRSQERSIEVPCARVIYSRYVAVSGRHFVLTLLRAPVPLRPDWRTRRPFDAAARARRFDLRSQVHCQQIRDAWVGVRNPDRR